MIADEIREKLQNIIRGERTKGQDDACATIWNILCSSFGTGATVKAKFESRSKLKEEQASFLKDYAIKENLWLNSMPSGSQYLAEGGESKVYLAKDGNFVIKINDSGYYATWTEYFTSVMLHNMLFFNTPYFLFGFTNFENKFCAVVQQQFVKGGQATLESIEEFLNYNEFIKTRRQDYYNNEFGIALEDMHDENVIAVEDVLFFIDTVFYMMK